jgi:pili/flagellar assembly PapD-like chaperone
MGFLDTGTASFLRDWKIFLKGTLCMSQLKAFSLLLSDFSCKTFKSFQVVLLGCIGFSTMINLFAPETALAQKVIGDGLLVAPIEFKLGGRNRSGVVTVQNQAPERTTYRLSIVSPLKMDEGADASKWIRFSPRRMTLNPGESQVVRVLLRKPLDAEKGKYMARLLVQAIPPEPKPVKAEKPQEIVSVNLVIVYGVTVPIRIDNQF